MSRTVPFMRNRGASPNAAQRKIIEKQEQRLEVPREQKVEKTGDPVVDAAIGIEALPTIPTVPALAKLWRRILGEIRAKAPAAIDAGKIAQEIAGVKFGMRCMMILGGYRYREGLKETDEEIQGRADATVTLIMGILLRVRAAEDVVVRHNLTAEYQAQLTHLEHSLSSGLPAPTAEEIEKMKSLLGTMKEATIGKGAPAEGVTLGDAEENGGTKLSEAGGS